MPDVKTVQKTYETLASLEKKLLRFIVKTFAGSSFSWENLKQLGEWKRQKATTSREDSFSVAELKVGLLRLRQQGIIQVSRKPSNECIYAIPYETLPMWHSLVMLGKHDRSSLQIIESADVESVCPRGTGLAHELLRLLVYVGNHECNVSVNGIIYKRHVQKIVQQFTMVEHNLHGIQLKGERFEFADVYPPHFAVVFHIALKLGLIRYASNATRLILEPKAIDPLFLLSNEELQTALYRMWMKLYMPSPIWMQHLTLLLIADLSGAWITINSLFLLLQRHGIETDKPDAEFAVHAFVNRWLKPLTALGWGELGNTKKHGPVFRTIPAFISERKAKLHLLPNYEIIVPPEIPFHIRWKLERVADHLQTDQISTYQVTKKSMDRARKYGESAETARFFLASNSLHGIPENVNVMIGQWLESGFENNRSGVPGEKPRDLSDQPLNDTMLRDFAVVDDNDGAVHEVRHINDLYPELDKIPVMWLNESRCYHPSTRKQLVKQAIEWGAHIKIDYAKSYREVIPLEINDGGINWELIGVYEANLIELSSGQWKEIQLILPGINDLQE